MALAATGALGSKAPQVLDWLSGAGKSGLGIVPHWAQIAAPLGYMGYTNRPGTKEPMAGVTPTTPPVAPAPAPTTTPTLPTPGEDVGAGTPTQPTFFTDEQGIRWIYDEYTGAWSQVNAPTPPRTDTGLTPEQQIAQAETQRAAQVEQIKLQMQLEQQAMERQMEMQRQMQAASAAQQMAQMYAADPYKYWAQMGAGTPEAVARLTGGQVGAGEQFQQGVPLSTPSQQWWGNLLPSEQQQISGGLNWLGVNPQDWFAMQQRMIPGLGARQIEPSWAR